MTKSQIRTLKSHYLSRWAVLRQNQKQDQKVLLLIDQFVLKNLTCGDTLCFDCLGEMYQDIITNLSTEVNKNKKYNSLVLINNLEFKYKTLDQIASYIDELASKVLLPNGRVILSFEHRFLIYNRIDVSVDTMLGSWMQHSKKFKLHRMLNLLGNSQPGYGDYFFCLDYK
jgi:hypothetical protein